MAHVPTVMFNNGHVYPILGLGTWKYKDEDVTAAVEYAIHLGYRHFDCAYVYQNEREVGEAISNQIEQCVVRREDLFITSKLWNTFHRPGAVEFALRQSLRNLGLTYLDLYLMHWPLAFQEGARLLPFDSNMKIIEDEIDYVDTWRAMEDLQKKGLVKSIGVCNFNRRQLERLLRYAQIAPVTNQVECHPYLNQERLIEFCRSRGILITAYYPVCSPDRPWAGPDDPLLLDDLRLRQIAHKYKKTSAQVVLRYQVQRGNIVISRSLQKSAIEEDIGIFDFELLVEEMKYISTFECRGRSFTFLRPSILSIPRRILNPLDKTVN